MYGLQVPGEVKVTLAADDVSMVKMGMVGQDLAAGTADDYSIALQFVETCTGSENVLVTLGKAPEGTAAFCDSAVDFSFPQNPLLARHMTLQPPPGDSFIITLNQELKWDTEESEDVFASSFETGDTSDWSSVAFGE